MRLLLAALVMSTSVFSQVEFLPVLMIEPITIETPGEYAGTIAETNALMRERHETPLYLRVYVTPSMIGLEQRGFALIPSASMTDLMAAREAFGQDPALGTVRAKLSELSSAGPASYLKAIRFDGTHSPGWLSNTLVQTVDEQALLARVEKLVALLLGADHAPVFINVFRFVAGPGPETHLISINASSSADLAAKLDHLSSATDPLKDSSITLISRTVYRELTPPPAAATETTPVN